MTESADAIREQGAYLLNPLPGGGYKRPYPSKTIEVSFMTLLPVYAGDSAVVNDGFLDPGNSKFKKFEAPQKTTIEDIFRTIEKIANVTFVFTDTPGTGAIRLGTADLKYAGGVNWKGYADLQTPTINDIFIRFFIDSTVNFHSLQQNPVFQID